VPARPGAVLDGALIATGFLVLFFLLPHELASDDFARFADIEDLLHHGTLADSKFSLVMPLVSAPFLLLGEVVKSPEWWATRFNVIVAAAGCAALLALLRGRVDGALLRRLVLCLLFASLLTNRLRDYNPEVLTAMLVAVGVVVLATRRSALAGWSAIVVGVVNTPAAFVGLVLLGAAESARTRRLRHLAPIAAAAVLVGLEAWIRRGSPFTTGYEGDHGIATVVPYSGRAGFSLPFTIGLVSILFSFGRGLLFFTPGLVLWLTDPTRRLAGALRHTVLLWLLFLAGLVLVYAKWWSWYAGVAWGPRFFAFAAIPASLAIALRIGRAGESALADASTLLVLALSGWVAVTGALSDLSELRFCSEGAYALEAMCWYVPEFSTLWQPLLHFPDVTARTGVVAAFCAAVFVRLAAPLVTSLLRVRPSPAWAAGWRL
jgi:hypothetical protein